MESRIDDLLVGAILLGALFLAAWLATAAP
jgi:hypothetical protein